MEIISFKEEDLKSRGINTACRVFTIHVIVKDVKMRADEMTRTIKDTSWIRKFDSIDQAALNALCKKTIARLADEIFSNVSANAPITADFGEYMISDTAQCTLEKQYLHKKAPLAELFKEKLAGNPGFDFHTESAAKYIAFGEAKYSGDGDPYGRALNQIIKFVNDEKDVRELLMLKKFLSRTACLRAKRKTKAYVAAFSLNSKNPTLIFNNLLASKSLKELLCHAELYLIGVEVKRA